MNGPRSPVPPTGNVNSLEEREAEPLLHIHQNTAYRIGEEFQSGNEFMTEFNDFFENLSLGNKNVPLAIPNELLEDYDKRLSSKHLVPKQESNIEKCEHQKLYNSSIAAFLYCSDVLQLYEDSQRHSDLEEIKKARVTNCKWRVEHSRTHISWQKHRKYQAEMKLMNLKQQECLLSEFNLLTSHHQGNSPDSDHNFADPLLSYQAKLRFQSGAHLSSSMLPPRNDPLALVFHEIDEYMEMDEHFFHMEDIPVAFNALEDSIMNSPQVSVLSNLADDMHDESTLNTNFAFEPLQMYNFFESQEFYESIVDQEASLFPDVELQSHLFAPHALQTQAFHPQSSRNLSLKRQQQVWRKSRLLSRTPLLRLPDSTSQSLLHSTCPSVVGSSVSSPVSMYPSASASPSQYSMISRLPSNASLPGYEDQSLVHLAKQIETAGTLPSKSKQENFSCHNCETKATPLWRRDDDGNPLCNACGLFYKLHGTKRPLKLKTDFIKRRNRQQEPPQLSSQGRRRSHRRLLREEKIKKMREERLTCSSSAVSSLQFRPIQAKLSSREVAPHKTPPKQNLSESERHADGH